MTWITYEPPTPPLELRDEMEIAATASIIYYILLALSAAIATMGLILDSSAVIIGAMIIAPLMNPIIAHSFSLARSNRKIWALSLFSIVSGILVVLTVSYSVAFVVDFQLQGREILSRGNPNLLDLGIAIASGIAGAIAWSQRRIASALPGVAIAVALVPPLCTAGIAFASGDKGMRDPNFTNLERVESVEWGALLLFFTNLAAILVFGAAVFFIRGYAKYRPIGLGLIAPLLLVILLAFPLSRKFNGFFLKGRSVDVLRELALDFPDWDEAQLTRIRIGDDAGTMVVNMRVEAAAGVIGPLQRKLMADALSAHFARPVKVRIKVFEYELLKTEGW
ncbi:MAG: DUF389 domain-containing protein [Verrucomicrobiales bacterium]